MKEPVLLSVMQYKLAQFIQSPAVGFWQQSFLYISASLSLPLLPSLSVQTGLCIEHQL